MESTQQHLIAIVGSPGNLKRIRCALTRHRWLTMHYILPGLYEADKFHITIRIPSKIQCCQRCGSIRFVEDTDYIRKRIGI